ncbi:tRNA (adenosine(37)-N6)-threonylcarbamoyltransferase complex dimerization subunit type 1 TsaB [Desulfotalea psychrophila]|uniref:N(6)-L-threonylcarbamoyladenine synthase n=1 Tax=Desulfotalea psychrophila (strain LSv54 / DSM 12343) TaxID=177439 RepID=Q6AP33_DESPS|nr:tRNA (adenosine(37)-N6)-threonylcarbamoyltransferase complex dimerization subunit type 1 TsaB [Desulfotalea psychrophila]CAG35891.1 related to glycoprotein endopeptidase [Desulfotalea psychrophila LSv54]
MTQPVLLAIDTATNCSSVAITRGDSLCGEVIASLSLSSGITHSRRLLTSIEWLMAEVGMDWQGLTGIAVSLGPGSFTGLRIGMATAKGLATAAGLPLYGVSSLDVLASRCVTDKLICVALDARKKEVYTALYRRVGGEIQRLGDYQVLAPESLVAMIDEPVLFVGDGVRVYSDRLSLSALAGAEIAPAILHTISATALGFCAADCAIRGEMLDTAAAVPLYVRASDAELNLGIKVTPRPIPC